MGERKRKRRRRREKRTWRRSGKYPIGADYRIIARASLKTPCGSRQQMARL